MVKIKLLNSFAALNVNDLSPDLDPVLASECHFFSLCCNCVHPSLDKRDLII